jgi:hypothetical protein
VTPEQVEVALRAHHACCSKREVSAVLDIVRAAVAEERERCARIAVDACWDACWEAMDMKVPKARWQHKIAGEIAGAIRARPTDAQ